MMAVYLAAAFDLAGPGNKFIPCCHSAARLRVQRSKGSVHTSFCLRLDLSIFSGLLLMYDWVGIIVTDSRTGAHAVGYILPV
jgi:hypothetical protein